MRINKNIDFFYGCAKIIEQGDVMSKNLNYTKTEIKKVLNEFKVGTNNMFKEFFNKETNKKQRANMWTFLRLIVPIPIILCSTGAMLMASNILYGVTAGLVGFGALTDYFDGKSARKYDSTSEYGKLLDQFADKIFAGIVAINLLLINPVYLISIIGELLIAGVNLGYKLKHKELNISSSKIGKIKQWPLFVSLGLGFLSPINSVLLTIANSSIVVTSLFQLLTTISYIDGNNKEIKKLTEEKHKDTTLTIEEKEENIKVKELILTKENKSTTEKLQELRDFRNSINQDTKIKNEENTTSSQKTKKL